MSLRYKRQSPSRLPSKGGRIAGIVGGILLSALLLFLVLASGYILFTKVGEADLKIAIFTLIFFTTLCTLSMWVTYRLMFTRPQRIGNRGVEWLSYYAIMCGAVFILVGLFGSLTDRRIIVVSGVAGVVGGFSNLARVKRHDA